MRGSFETKVDFHANAFVVHHPVLSISSLINGPSGFTFHARFHREDSPRSVRAVSLDLQLYRLFREKSADRWNRRKRGCGTRTTHVEERPRQAFPYFYRRRGLSDFSNIPSTYGSRILRAENVRAAKATSVPRMLPITFSLALSSCARGKRAYPEELVLCSSCPARDLSPASLSNRILPLLSHFSST